MKGGKLRLSRHIFIRPLIPPTGDKRLDEWVAANRVSTLLSAPSLGTELSQYNLLSVSSVAS